MSHLLGGQVICRQPEAGHRSGIEPVLLAASVPARPGERVFEAGTGPGAALLCLAHRVPGVSGLGVDISAPLVDLARDNAVANGLAGLRFACRDVEAPDDEGVFDHAMANPPWHDPRATASPDAGRDVARRATGGLLGRWVAALGRRLRHRGTLTVIVGTARFPEILAALAPAQCGSPALFPLWPRQGVAAKLMLIRAVRGGRGPARTLPGLVLHGDGGGFTEATEAVLRSGHPLPL